LKGGIGGRSHRLRRSRQAGTRENLANQPAGQRKVREGAGQERAAGEKSRRYVAVPQRAGSAELGNSHHEPGRGTRGLRRAQKRCARKKHILQMNPTTFCRFERSGDRRSATLNVKIAPDVREYEVRRAEPPDNLSVSGGLSHCRSAARTARTSVGANVAIAREIRRQPEGREVTPAATVEAETAVTVVTSAAETPKARSHPGQEVWETSSCVW
jgi:hypothetical protein